MAGPSSIPWRLGPFPQPWRLGPIPDPWRLAVSYLVSIISLKEAAVKLGHVTAAEFDALVKPEDMTHP